MARENPYAWLLLSVLWVFTFLGATARFIQSYYQPEMSADMHVGRGFLSLTWSLGILIAAVCAPVGGLLVDRWGYKKVMVYSGLFGCVSILVVLLFNGPIGYFLGFGIIAGLGGIGSAAGYVLVSNWFKYHRAKALMLIGAAASLGLAALTPLFVQYREWLNWVDLYWILLAVNIISVLFTILFIKENKQIVQNSNQEANIVDDPSSQGLQTTLFQDMRKSFVNFKNYCKIPVVMVVMFALFVCGFNMGTVERHLMAIHQVAHVHEAMFISSLSVLGLLEVFGGVLFSFLLDHTNRLLALSILYGMRIVAFVLLFMHFDLSPILFSVIFGASYLGAIPGGILVVTERIEKEGGAIGLQVGVLLLVHQLGGVVAGVAGGINFDLFQNYQLLIAVDISLVVICAAAYYVMYLKSTNRSKVMDNGLNA